MCISGAGGGHTCGCLWVVVVVCAFETLSRGCLNPVEWVVDLLSWDGCGWKDTQSKAFGSLKEKWTRMICPPRLKPRKSKDNLC